MIVASGCRNSGVLEHLNCDRPRVQIPARPFITGRTMSFNRKHVAIICPFKFLVFSGFALAHEEVDVSVSFLKLK